jgi:nucleotide-binding universal stress UspA family protein
MSKNLYIIPYDFSAVAEDTLKYTLFFSSNLNVDIQLLHLVSSETEVLRAHAKLETILAATPTTGDISISQEVRIGNIFEDIGKIALEKKAQLIVMGTHGASGMQKVFGSHAMKVITHSDTPFLVVQKNTLPNDIKRIVVPIDLTKESLQVVNIAGDLAKMHNAEVHVIGEKQGDEILGQQLKNRILIVKNQYSEREVKCHVELLKSGGSYSRKIMHYSDEKEIDLIAISYHSESLLPQFDTFAQNLITNERKLPCLVINSKLASALYF